MVESIQESTWMTVTTPTQAQSEITKQEWENAQAFYEDRILPAVLDKESFGKILVMDVDTQEYWIDRSRFGAEVAHKLREERPEARLILLRIGYDAAYGHITATHQP